MPSTKRKAPGGPSTSLTTPSSSKKGKSTPAPPPPAPPPSELPLGKALASTSKKTRDMAIRSLSSFLSSPRPSPLSSLELSKLWQGIFYCFWMSDKPLVQQDLANKMADLCLVFPAETEEKKKKNKEGMTRRAREGLEFWNMFWRTMVQQWHGIDKHRINKFLLLMRRFLNAGFRLLATEEWNEEATKLFVDMLCAPGGPLAVNDTKVPVSITYHIADIYLEELENAVTWSQEQPSTNASSLSPSDEDDFNVTLVPVTKLLSPFIRSATVALNNITYGKVMESVIEPFLEDTLRAAEHLLDEDDDDKHEQDNEDDEPELDGQVVEQDEEETSDVESDADSNDFPLFASSDGEEQGAVLYPMLLALAEPVSPPVNNDDDDDEEEEVDEGPLALRKEVYRLLFEAASSPSAHHPRRRRIYEFWRVEQDRLNGTDGSGVEAPLVAEEGNADNDDDDEA